MDGQFLAWQGKKKTVDEAQRVLETEVQCLAAWINDIEGKDDGQMKEYLKNRPESLKTTATEKTAPRKRVRKTRKPKHSAILSAVLKFHKEDLSLKENA